MLEAAGPASCRVTTSMSRGTRPSSRSRTAPPTSTASGTAARTARRSSRRAGGAVGLVSVTEGRAATAIISTSRLPLGSALRRHLLILLVVVLAGTGGNELVDAVQQIEVELAVEVAALVLDDLREQVLGVDPDRPAVAVQALDHDLLRAGHDTAVPGQGEAAFLT